MALEGLEVWTRLKRELPKEAETPGQELNPPCWPDRLKHSGSPGVWAQECPYRDSIYNLYNCKLYKIYQLIVTRALIVIVTDICLHNITGLYNITFLFIFYNIL